jgi:murein DD-endopeptidase MepM/ murein hydrolase activator NlpD
VSVPIVATIVAWLSVNQWINAPLPTTDAVAAAAPLNPTDLNSSSTAPSTLVPMAVRPSIAPFRRAEVIVTSGHSLSQILKDFGVLKDERSALLKGLAPLANPAKLKLGTVIKASYQGPEDQVPSQIEIRSGDGQIIAASHVGPRQWNAEARDIAVERHLAAFSGVVRTTLWGSALEAGMDPQLIQRLTEVFAWHVDFNRDVLENDRWRLTIERLYSEGKPIGYGDIIAAEYRSGVTSHTAVRYTEGSGRVRYYAPDGTSMQRQFLKSPLRYGHITSGFAARRFHPILKVNKPHLGVDYGAPVGTPVMTVGDGTVTFAGYRGQSGRMVVVRHNGVYTTEYKHLSAFARGIAAGAAVTVGQVIAYVGATGLATGPHLHFEFHVGNTVVDPQKLWFPAADPIPAERMAAFKMAAAQALDELPPWSRGLLTQAALERPLSE